MAPLKQLPEVLQSIEPGIVPMHSQVYGEGRITLRIAAHPSLSPCCCDDQRRVMLDSGADTSVCEEPSVGCGGGQGSHTFSCRIHTCLPGSLSLRCGVCVLDLVLARGHCDTHLCSQAVVFLAVCKQFIYRSHIL